VRIFRVFVVSALAASAALVAPAPALAVSPPANVITLDGGGSDVSLGQDLVFDNGVQASLGLPNTDLQFRGATPSSADAAQSLDLDVQSNDGTDLAVGTYSLTNAASTPGTAFMSIAVDFTSVCYATAGSLNITELTTDIDGKVASFVASYAGVTCDATTGALSGTIRWNPATPTYTAVSTSPRNWDFGDLRTKANGLAKVITFANRGTDPVAYAAATITGSSNAFSITADHCSNAIVAAHNSCTITVVPHPQYAVTNTYFGSAGTLHLPTTTGLATRQVQFREEGHTYATTYVQGGAARIHFTWGQLPTTMANEVTGYSVYRGTSPGHETYRTHVQAGTHAITDYAITAGRTYYYTVHPTFAGGAGDFTTEVAAIAWPKYSAGMYHHFSSSFRLVNGHKVTAGHPYSVKVLGAHGIPRSGVAAVALEIHATHPSKSTSVTVYPSGTRRPAAADVIVSHGSARSNFAITKVGSGGRIVVATSHGTTPVSIDVSGYYSANGLAHSHGSGQAMHTYTRPGTIMDTKKYRIGALKHDYYVDAPVDFDVATTPHVTSLVVQVTAYGSTGSGTIAAYPTNRRAPGTSVLSYGRGTTTNLAIVSAGRFYASTQTYPSVSFLNRGAKPVQLIVTILGFYDDASYELGERYLPTSPVHLLSRTFHAGSTVMIDPRSHAGYWTSSMNLKISAATPSRTTSLRLWPRFSGVRAPGHGQVAAPKSQSTTSTTLQVVGSGDQYYLRNAAGTTKVNVWSFGRFGAYPVPLHTRSYASVTSTSSSTTTPTSAPSAVRATSSAAGHGQRSS
jgi:hypothetical protein